MSAHRDPETVADYARNARMRGLKVIIAGAGLAAALPGVVAAHTDLPVIGVPLTSKTSVARRPGRAARRSPRCLRACPWHCVGVDNAKNAAVLAAKYPRRVIDRYTRPEMGAVWSEQRKLDTWLAGGAGGGGRARRAGGRARRGRRGDPRARHRSRSRPCSEREQVTDHDVAAFVDVVAASVGEAGPLGAPRPHLVRRAGHRAGAAAAPGRPDPRRRARTATATR